MSNFSKNWEDSGYNRDFLEIADIINPDKQRLLKILLSYTDYFFSNKKNIEILDLGCGDGILTKYLYKNNPNALYSVCDGSSLMIDKAKNNLQQITNCNFYNNTFEEMISENVFNKEFDLIVSSLAIHHITHEIKLKFFEKLLSSMKAEGFFINIDICLSENQEINKWFYVLWKEWILEFQQKNNIEKDYSNVPEEAPKKPENHFNTLDKELELLKTAGFRNIECYYKYGLFCIYGGQK